jgi:hypothetical protein
MGKSNEGLGRAQAEGDASEQPDLGVQILKPRIESSSGGTARMPERCSLSEQAPSKVWVP